MSTNQKAKYELANLFRARFPYIYINTWEEDRVTKLILDIGQDETYIRHTRSVYIWTQTSGFECEEMKAARRDITRPVDALEFIRKCKENALFVLKDFHVFLEDARRRQDYSVIRKMRDIIPSIRESEYLKNVIIIAPVTVIPNELQKEITVFDYPLPNVDEIEESLDHLIDDNGLSVQPELRERIAKSALGLTIDEAENAFSLAIVNNKGIINANAIRTIFDEKNQVIKKNGILEFIKSDISIDDIGGLENLKSWLKKRNNSWLDSAAEYNIPAPKGVLITGIPGCGKSLTAKAMSAIWELPLLKLDMGKIYSGLVGSSEQNMRRALSTAETVAPSILWIDEIEKGLAGHGSSGDSGTSTRILGQFLTWMQEKTAPVFVIATANDISSLPPELLRKGRFDEIFFVDLPTKNERKKIFEVHLNKRVKSSDVGRDIVVDDALLEHLSSISEGFVGAEIEQAVIAALYEAFFNHRRLQTEDLDYALKNTVPLSVTQKEQIRRLRDWARIRAVSATAVEDLKSYETDQPEAPDSETKEIDSRRGGRILDF